MELDVSFLGSSSDATGEAPSVQPDVIDSAPTIEQTPQPEAAPVETAAEEVPAQEPSIGEPVTETEEPLDEEDIQKLLADNPNSPKWFREKLKQIAAYSGKLKAEKTDLQSQFENLKTQYEGKESLLPTDLERLRQAEEKYYKLTSYTASTEDVLNSIKETVSPNKMAELKSHLTWEFLEKPDGQPDLENLQVIIDRFAGTGEGEAKVAAKDVLNAIQAIKRGTVKPEEFHEFTSDVEYDAFLRAQEVEREINAQRSLAADNAKYQETATRQAILQNVLTSIQGEFQPKVEALLNKFQLNFVENEPKVAADIKNEIRNRVAAEINRASMENASLTDVFKALDLLSKPTGQRADAIQQEINSYINSFPYQTAVNRGLSELMSSVEKAVTAEAYRYKLMMMGYEQEVSKGQNAREIVGAPKQTDVLTEYTPEQLAAMSAAERRHATLLQISNSLREGKTGRYGG